MSSDPSEPRGPAGPADSPDHPPAAAPHPDPAAPGGSPPAQPTGGSFPPAPAPAPDGATAPLPQSQPPLVQGDGQTPAPSERASAVALDGPDGRPDPVDEPAWAAWQGLLGLFAWGVGTFLVGTIVVVAAAATGLASLDGERVPPGVLIGATVAGDVVFLAVPLAFAAITTRPRLWHFGLRRTRFWPTLGWAALALFGWFVFSLIYRALIDPQGSQSTADDLGVNRSTTLLIVGGFVVIVLAPIFEEFFFRGFIYRTLRNSLVRNLGLGAGIALATVLDGLLFGFIHATNTPIAILPVLAVLGAAFCLVYERTGSLFTVVALHAVVNTLGYLGVAKNSAPVALGFGGLMIVGCIVVPRLLAGDSRRAEAPALS